MSNKEFETQDLSMGNTGVKFWDPAWSKVDVPTVTANRTAAIAEGLRRDPDYSANAASRIGGN
jgi:hypothetical protein